MFTFCLQASLVVSFQVAKAVEHVRRRVFNFPSPNLLRILEVSTEAFIHVLPTFYWSSVLLSLGLVIASLLAAFTASGKKRDEQLEQWKAGEDFTIYDSQLVALGSLFSVQITFIINLMLEVPGRRRRGLNGGILSLLGILLIGLIRLTVVYDAQLPEDVDKLLEAALQSDQNIRLFLQVVAGITLSLMTTCGVIALAIQFGIPNFTPCLVGITKRPGDTCIKRRRHSV
ncbi:hypothetical protein BDP81DRAFT_435967 [Colletotrichum phormii]|uniref:Uncharacterized protein n=1 Tax=Colletotrichum phormii TaxID=359342 RepID=A0AAI9ZLK5_9PEZI|nr:uncharacterized protein BDP81DRAFT_435967 [Colletotrichum phormii]KAK1625509.1 hypothetical protein BDP81DRAFT_435967 [Colletotrichum phormii]